MRRWQRLNNVGVILKKILVGRVNEDQDGKKV